MSQVPPDPDDGRGVYAALRPLLVSIAYEMVGSVGEAEDIRAGAVEPQEGLLDDLPRHAAGSRNLSRSVGQAAPTARAMEAEMPIALRRLP